MAERRHFLDYDEDYGGLIVDPVYTLAELLAGVDDEAERIADEHDDD